MKIEILYSEIANLYGEKTGIKYLQECLKDSAEFVFTSLNDVPAFVNEPVSMIFMGPMTENGQEIVIDKLSAYKERISLLIESGTLFLCTGNAFEVFLSYIEKDDGTKIEGLNIFPGFYAKRRMFNRYNSLYLGEADSMKIVGYKAQFSQCYGDNSDCYFCKTVRGDGINPESKLEGIRKNNFIGTYLLGPLLIINPDFTKYILRLIGAPENIAFEKTAYEAYSVRLKEYENPNLRFK